MSKPEVKGLSHRRSLLQTYPKRLDIVLLLLVSSWLLFMGLRLPVLTIQQMWMKNTFSVLTGIENLYQEKQVFLACIVFFFSIVFPIIKLTALIAIWFIRMRDEKRQRLLYLLSALGKWSMLDVFVVAVIIVTVKLGVLVKATPEPGIYYFGMSILLAMAATALEERLAKKLSR